MPHSYSVMSWVATQYFFFLLSKPVLFQGYEPQLLTVTPCGSHENGPCRPPVTGDSSRAALALKSILCSPTGCSPLMPVCMAWKLRQNCPGRPEIPLLVDLGSELSRWLCRSFLRLQGCPWTPLPLSSQGLLPRSLLAPSLFHSTQACLLLKSLHA